MFFFLMYRGHGPRGRRQGLLPPAAGQNDNDTNATTHHNTTTSRSITLTSKNL
jgi:hypothetical protein